jgi:hypothetical protein
MRVLRNSWMRTRRGRSGNEGLARRQGMSREGRTVNEVMVVPPCTMRVAEVEDTAGGVVGTVGAAVVGAVVGVGAAVVGQGEKYVDTGDATNAGLMDRDVTLAVVVLREHPASAAVGAAHKTKKQGDWIRWRRLTVSLP